MGPRRYTGDALLPHGIERVTLVFDGLKLVEVGPARAGEPVLDGLLVPGLINAHTHLELSHMGIVPGGHGLPAWIRAQFARRSQVGEADREREARIAADALALTGTAAVCDVAGGDSTAGLIAEAGLLGVVQRERLGQDTSRTRAGIDDAAGLHAQGAVAERPTAHAPYSTHPDLARALLAPGPAGLAATVHLAEHAAEREFLTEGTGPFAEILDSIGVRWSFSGPFAGPVDWLRRVGGLGPHVAAVHGVDLRPDEQQALADHRCGLILCVRSNLHIGGVAPDVGGLLQRGVRLALGTDGLVSCTDGDVLGEIPALHRLEPQVDAATWLHLATAGGADVLGLRGLGRLSVGSSPGLVRLDSDLDGLLKRAPKRRWLVRAGVSA